MVVLLCWVKFMLSVTNKPLMLIVVMLNVEMLSVVAPSGTTTKNYRNKLEGLFVHYQE